MTGQERLLLYRTAIETGFRAKELRALTANCLHLDLEQPFLTLEGTKTKNSQSAKQYVQPDLAAQLRTHVESCDKGSQLFRMPHESNLARMIRKDLALARDLWLQEAQDDTVLLEERLKSDFLLERNQAGETLDFHSLRHTCGAWLAMSGCHPKDVQAVMRHQSITLSMDTYGHLFPGQVANAVKNFANLLPNQGDQTGEQAPSETACAGCAQDAKRYESVRRGAQ